MRAAAGFGLTTVRLLHAQKYDRAVSASGKGRPAAMGVVDRIDAFQQRHRTVGLPLAVVYKFFDDQSNYLSALLTYYGFLSLFPLLLLLVTSLGFVLEGDPEMQERVLDSALSQFPVIGAQLADDVRTLHGNSLAVVAGALISVYGCLGVAQAAQSAMNRIWGVARHQRPNPITSRLRSLFLIAVVGGGILATTVGSGLLTSGPGFGPVDVVVTVVAVATNSLLFMVAYLVLTVRHLALREVRSGAIAAAVIWQLLQMAGTSLMSSQLRGASATYGAFGVVLGLVAWIHLGALNLLLCAQFNAVRAERMWPRSLLTPFTDNVQLTRGDREAYESYANTERHKGFETVDVDFHEDDPRS
jgi:YihY family inner membrane protein